MAIGFDNLVSPNAGVGLAPVIANLTEINDQGQAMVLLDGDEQPTQALVLRGALPIPVVRDGVFPLQVLVLEASERTRQPIILGIVDSVVQDCSHEHEAEQISESKKKVKLEAADELELACGKSSIKLRKNGQIRIAGIDVTSRAVRRNKIKGGSVGIN